jgi:DNA-binding CsgD family transcriptional regulator
VLSNEAGSRSSEDRPIIIRRSTTNAPLSLYVLPIPIAATAMNSFLTHARTIVLVTDADPGSPPDPALIRDIMGLTLGEARIASLIGAGLPIREAANKLSITEQTARTVLKRIFSKLDISRQSELASLMTKLLLR